MMEFESDLENDLHAARPAPSGQLLDALVSKMQHAPVATRRGSWSLRLAVLASVVMFAGLGALGGVSVASGVGKHVAKTTVSSGHHDSEDDEGERRQGGKEHPDRQRKVPLCLTGQSEVRWFKVKKATKLVAKGKARPAVGEPPACEVI
jgi:hypothetical protein